MTNNPFFPSFMADVTNKQFMYINETEDLDVIIPRPADHGIQRFALVTEEHMPIDVPSQIGNIGVQKSAPLIYDLVSIQTTRTGKEP